MNTFTHPKINIIKGSGLTRLLLLAVLGICISIQGFGQLTVDFIAVSTSVCSGSAVTFTDNSTGASDTAKYAWIFGSGASPSSATGIGPHIVYYTGSGASTVSLTITDETSETKTKAGYISIIAVPLSPVITVSDNCDTTSTLSTTADGILLWSTTEMSSAIIVKTPGVYTVTTTINGCTSLPGSGNASPKMAPAKPVESIDCSLGYTRAAINILSPLGEEYEYRLDTGPYQTGTSFKNVSNGSHKITVRNASGCITAGSFFEVSCNCVDAASVTLGSAGGNTCEIIPVTVSGNSFGGVADYVTISDNGSGSVSPTLATNSPFSFTYTPKSGDEGKTVIITVTTNNPMGTPCVAAKETYALTVNANPVAPRITKIIQPTCSLQTATLELDNLPNTGTWTLTSSPDGITTTGNGVGTTILNMVPGIFTYTVTSETGCISRSSSNVVIESQPVTPTPPEIGTVNHPTCFVSTGSVQLNGLPAIGNWTLTRSPGGVKTTGSGTSKLVTDLQAGNCTFTVTNSAGCTSVASASLTVDSQPANPSTPIIGTITPPTCLLSTGSVELNGLPATGSWILKRYPGTVTSSGTGISVTISGLQPGVYNFALTNETGCISVPSANVIIPAQPLAPSPPATGVITLPTCTEATGSVVLSGLPASVSWSIIRVPDGVVTTGTGTTTTISGLSVGKYAFSVTGSEGCISTLSSEVSIPLQPGLPLVIITNPPALCSTGYTDLTSPAITEGSTPGLALSYWTNASGTTPYTTPATAVEGTWYIKGATIAGCFDIKPVTVTVNQLQEADAGPDQLLENQFVTILDAEPGIYPETGFWSVISGSGKFSDIADPKTSVSGLSPGRNAFLWSLQRGSCPATIDTVLIIVNDLRLRTLITPNMDGRNDYFVVKGLNTMGKTELVVFDRRGVQVFKNENYDNLWNGIDYNENPLQDDTYFYVIRSESGRTINGFIVIRR